MCQMSHLKVRTGSDTATLRPFERSSGFCVPVGRVHPKCTFGWAFCVLEWNFNVRERAVDGRAAFRAQAGE